MSLADDYLRLVQRDNVGKRLAESIPELAAQGFDRLLIVEGDAERRAQVVSNLLTNAAKSKVVSVSAGLPDDLRIVAITGYGQDADRRRAQEAGFDIHLVKPVNLDVLEKLLLSTSRR